MIDINNVMSSFCEAGAEAVQRYVEISGLPPLKMPEYFMPAFILDRLGSEITATLETNFSDLVIWNRFARERQGLPMQTHDERMLLLAQQIGGQRVDMALFAGQEEGKPKEEQDFLALIEFKRGWIDGIRIPGTVSDRDKVLMLLSHIDTCPWGIVCGWCSEEHRKWHLEDAMVGTKDKWYQAEIRLDNAPTTLFFGARLIEQGSDRERLEDLLRSL